MESGIFAGLENMGLGNLKDIDIYKNNINNSDAVETKEETVPKINEEDMLFDKSYECPVCTTKFKARTLRTGKARLLGTDIDLRAKFEGIEPLKYDVVLCPRCGFTALTRYFIPIPSVQRKLILENITANFKTREDNNSTYSYEEAINRYKLALANAVVKMGKASEKAFICLRAGWLVRSYTESLCQESPVDTKKIKQTKELEEEFLKNAYEGFSNARQSEGFPMCGMDETTLDYILASLALRLEHFDVASKIISSLLVSPSCNNRMKDKVRDLKEELMSQMHNKSK